MGLRKKQSEFAFNIHKLIQFAYDNNYELTFGDAWAKTGHKKIVFIIKNWQLIWIYLKTENIYDLQKIINY